MGLGTIAAAAGIRTNCHRGDKRTTKANTTQQQIPDHGRAMPESDRQFVANTNTNEHENRIPRKGSTHAPTETRTNKQKQGPTQRQWE